MTDCLTYLRLQNAFYLRQRFSDLQVNSVLFQLHCRLYRDNIAHLVSSTKRGALTAVAQTSNMHIFLKISGSTTLWQASKSLVSRIEHNFPASDSFSSQVSPIVISSDLHRVLPGEYMKLLAKSYTFFINFFVLDFRSSESSSLKLPHSPDVSHFDLTASGRRMSTDLSPSHMTVTLSFVVTRIWCSAPLNGN